MKSILTFLLITISINLFSQAPGNWSSRGMGGGGAMFAPSINPSNSNELSIACDMTPLFQSTDQGGHWTTTPFNKISAGHASKMIYTNNPLIRYCISYPSVNGLDYVVPKKTTDGGSSWNQLSGNPDSTEEVYFLDVDYSNPSRVIMSYYGGIYFSSDGGSTFNQVHTASNPGAGEHVTDVLWNGNTIYVGMIDGILQSTNNGTSFSMMSSSGIPATDKILSFASGKEGTAIRFYAMSANSGDVYSGMTYGDNYNGIPNAVYQMDNASGTWTLVTSITSTSFPSQYPVILSMAKNDIDTLYAGGGTTDGTGPCIFRHTNAGWTYLFSTSMNQNIKTGWCGDNGDLDWSWAESLFGLQVNPLNSQEILISDWGFAHMSTNGGTEWKQVYTDISLQHPAGANTPQHAWYKGNGMENTSCWNICWLDSMNLLSGYSDITGMKSDDKGNRWKKFPDVTENSVYHIIKASNGTIYAAASSVHDMYQSTYLQDSRIDIGNGKIYFSTDNGNSFSTLTNLGVNKPVMWLAIDPTNSNRMYAAVAHSTLGGIYKTDNLNLGVSATWNKVSDPPRTEGHAFNIRVLMNGDLVVSYSGRRNSSGTFTASSGVFYSNDHGNTWSDRSDAGMQYWTKDIVIDPNDLTESTWYATVFSGWGGPSANNNGGGLYKTTDKGLHWTKISIEYRVNSITINPLNAAEAYYTTETAGLKFSSNFNTSSPSFSEASSYPFRHPLRVFFNPFKQGEIWVTNFGNGMYTSAVNTSNGIKDYVHEQHIDFTPNPASTEFTINIPSLSTSSELIIFDQQGKLVEQKHLANSRTPIQISHLKNGLYYIQIITAKNSHSGLLLIQH